MSYQVALAFKCDRCGRIERTFPPEWFSPGGTVPIRAHDHLPEGWLDRARPEAVRDEPAVRGLPFYEHVCPGCVNEGKDRSQGSPASARA